MKKIKIKVYAFLSLISILLMQTYVFADDATLSVSNIGTDTIKDVSGTGSIGQILNRYEDDLKSSNDTNKLYKLIGEKNKIKSREISDSVKNDILTNTIYKSKKQRLDGDSELAKITDTNIKTLALNELKNSTKKTKDTYKLIIKTSLSEIDLRDTLNFFDNVEIKYISTDIDNKNMFELDFSFKGNLGKAMANYMESGELPTTLFYNIEIVKPILLKQIGASNYLTGESLTADWGISKIGADKYQYSLSQKPKIKIGIIDTGIDYSHSELISNLDTNLAKNFVDTALTANDDNGHGTHVAGIIGAAVNSKGIFGVDSNVSLVPLKVLSRAGYGTSYGIVDAINYAANNGIKVVNLSLGGTGTPSNDIICSAITNAKSKGTISVVAAGNENADVNTKVPAGCSDAITVGAVDSTLTKASFSNYGSEVDVRAPGVSIYSTYKGNTYATMAGTSMATPFVTGLIGAVLSLTGGTYDSVKQALVTNGLAVNSNVNIGKFISMTNTMKSLGILDDSSYINTGTTNTGIINPPNTGTGIINTGSTNTGTTNVLPTITLSTIKNSINNYTITANAKDSDGIIVNYIVNKDGVFVSSGSVYNLIITKDTIVSIKVIDNKGGIAEASVNLKYESPIITNKLPVLSLINTKLSANNYQITANATDSDGKIVGYNFFVNNILVYSGTTNIYKLAITQNTTVKVVAIDNMGGTANQSLNLIYETIITNKLPIINSSYQSYNTSYNLITTSASDSDGYITNFSIYINDILTYNYSNLKYTSLSLSMYTIKGKTYTIKTVAKDNSGGTSEKTIIVK